MKSRLDLAEEKDLLSTLENLCFSYEELSVMKMQKIRDMVLSTREYFDSISHVYGQVKSSYKDRMLRIKKRRATSLDDNQRPNIFTRFFRRSSSEPTKKGSILVLLSANTKLHGSIVDEVFAEFSRQLQNSDADIMIVGKLGRDFYKSMPPPLGGKKYLYFEVPDMGFRLNDLQTMIYHLQKYDNITVFHGRYQSVLKQAAVASKVSGDEPLGEETAGNKELKFIFEPTLETIMDFFETYMFSVIFKQTMHEGQLARFASRITAMERALSAIEVEQSKLILKLSSSRALSENKQQLERISGMNLWQK